MLESHEIGQTKPFHKSIANQKSPDDSLKSLSSGDF